MRLRTTRDFDDGGAEFLTPDIDIENRVRDLLNLPAIDNESVKEGTINERLTTDHGLARLMTWFAATIAGIFAALAVLTVISVAEELGRWMKRRVDGK